MDARWLVGYFFLPRRTLPLRLFEAILDPFTEMGDFFFFLRQSSYGVQEAETRESQQENIKGGGEGLREPNL